MNKYLLFALAFIFSGYSLCFSQANKYTLNIHLSHIRSGYAKLMISGVNLNKDSAQHWPIEDGEVSIQGTLPQSHPYLAYIWINDSIATGNIIISPPQTQNIYLKDNQFGALPTDTSVLGLQNKALNEKLAFIDKNETARFYAQRSKVIKTVYHGNPPLRVLDSLNNILDKISYKKDTTIKNFIIHKPESYVGLLYLYDRVKIRGYSDELNNALNSLNDNPKNSDIGIMTKSIFEKAKRVAIGSPFPKLELLNFKNTLVDYNLSKKPKGHSKFTLIDFWYSNCGPCIAQFGQLKQLFDKYHNKGFDINSISTDSKAKMNDWKSVISKHHLPWIQYLDLNGVNAKNLNINSFPFNFLIDENGKILKKHISMAELEEMLNREFN